MLSTRSSVLPVALLVFALPVATALAADPPPASAEVKPPAAANAKAEADAKAPAGAKAATPPAAPAPAGAVDASGMTPDKVVQSYIKALQDHRFPDAYKYASKTLKAGKSSEEWSKEQQYVHDVGEVKIIDFKVLPAIIGADGIARVPNVLKSQDKFLNQLGLDEHEIYELIKEDGNWKVDQQTLAEGADRETYFPDDSKK